MSNEIKNVDAAKNSQAGRIPSPFSLPDEARRNIEISEKPVTLLHFVKRINAAADLTSMRELEKAAFGIWLLEQGYLKIISKNEDYADPDVKGLNAGITTEQRVSSKGGRYVTALYNSQAQRLLLEHLDEIIAISNAGVEKYRLLRFSLSPEAKRHVEITDEPVSLAIFAKHINEASDSAGLFKFNAASFSKCLLEQGYLTEEIVDGKSCKVPTEAGKRIGITTVYREGKDDRFFSALYNAEAQRFLIENMHEIISGSKTV